LTAGAAALLWRFMPGRSAFERFGEDQCFLIFTCSQCVEDKLSKLY
jgi:hypothetical protein